MQLSSSTVRSLILERKGRQEEQKQGDILSPSFFVRASYCSRMFLIDFIRRMCGPHYRDFCLDQHACKIWQITFFNIIDTSLNLQQSEIAAA